MCVVACGKRCGYGQEGGEYEENNGPDDDDDPTTSLPFDGILGLNRDAAALSHQLYKQGLIRRHIVGHCLERNHVELEDGVVGYLFFGALQKARIHDMTWTPMNTRSKRNE